MEKSREPQRMKPHRSPAQISVEAEAWLKNACEQVSTDRSIAEQRQYNYTNSLPISEKALKHHKITTSEIEINGVPCLVLNPFERKKNRTILYIFGGGFTVGSPLEDIPISASLAAKTGAQVISPAYRLAPEHPFPAALDDIATVARQIFTNDHNACIAGESAGANLALGVMHRLRQANLPMPQAAAFLSPPTDKTMRDDSFNLGRDPTLKPARIKQIEDAYIGDHDRSNPEISPIYGAFDAHFPPSIITTGTRDLLLSSSIRLARVMREAGMVVDLRVWEGMWHVFEYYPEIPEADASLTEIAAFLERHF